MDKQQIKHLVAIQRAYFNTGNTLPVPKRILALKKLKAAILHYQPQIEIALQKDLGKSAFESYMCESIFILMQKNNMSTLRLRNSLPEAIESLLLTVLFSL